MENKAETNRNSGKLKAMFLIPSLVGVLIFMIPVKYDGSWTVIVKIIADIISGVLAGILPILCVAILTVSAILAVVSLIATPKFSRSK